MVASSPAFDAPLLHALRELAEHAARAGGEMARDWARRPYAMRRKPDGSEVTEADEAVQAAVFAILRAARPHDALIAEEAVAPQDAASRPLPRPVHDRPCWVIDPIDGTRNFIRGLPGYCCSVGVMLSGMPVVGAIYDPTTDLLYSAAHGEPFSVNGQPHPAAGAFPPPSPTRRLMVGVPSMAAGAVHDLVHDWLERFVVRNYGSAALHLALVATGQLDAATAENTKLWDIAAGAAVVLASGGHVTSPSGQPVFPVDVATYVDQELPALAMTERAFTQLMKGPPSTPAR